MRADDRWVYFEVAGKFHGIVENVLGLEVKTANANAQSTIQKKTKQRKEQHNITK